jgi:hypothetical protein
MLLKELYSNTEFEQKLNTILPFFKEISEQEAFKKACELYGKEDADRIINVIKRIVKNKGPIDVEKEYKSKGLTPSPEVVTW